MSILCAVDFSEGSGQALTAAGRIAETYRQPLVIVYVADPLLATAEGFQAQRDPVGVLSDALGRFVNEVLGDGAAERHTLVVSIGAPAREILAACEARGAQLVVLATRRATGMGRIVFGSVAERVLRESTLPVLVVPPVPDSPRRTLGDLRHVLVPTDLGDHAPADVRIAARVAASSGAELRLLHVVPGDDAGRWSVVPATLVEAFDEQWRGLRVGASASALEALRHLAEGLEGDASPEVEVVEGSAPEEIAAAATRHDVDLVVLGLRGVPGLLGPRVGAIAYRVLCASTVPVLAVPDEARHGTALAFLETR